MEATKKNKREKSWTRESNSGHCIQRFRAWSRHQWNSVKWKWVAGETGQRQGCRQGEEHGWIVDVRQGETGL